MILSYQNVLGDHERHTITAQVTTDHPASSYGIPVVVLPDGKALDVQSWIILLYQVEEATTEEFEDLKRALNPYTTPSVAAGVLGSVKSERKTAAARRNAQRGGRPRKTKE